MEISTRIAIDDLSVGTTAHSSLHDERGVLLVPGGLEITNALLATLRARGVSALYWSEPPAGERAETSSASEPSVENRAKDVGAEDAASVYSSEQVERIRGSFQAGERIVESLIRSASKGDAIVMREADRQVENFIGELVDDPDPVVAGALEYEANLKLATRCIQFSVLSMAIGLRLKLGRSQIQNLGSAAMVHDWALFDLPVTSRFPHQTKDEAQRRQYLEHPLVAKTMLEYTDHVEPDVKILVSQVHELMDGSGFPSRLPASQIHPLSRILCVADAYLTMTSPPKGAARVVPCDAIAYLVAGVSRGQYSAKAVNGLLRAVTAYPIGSIVELSDTTRARVIRSNGEEFGSPILESLDKTGRIIRLDNEQLFIARPIVSSEINEVRLPDVYDVLGNAVDAVPA